MFSNSFYLLLILSILPLFLGLLMQSPITMLVFLTFIYFKVGMFSYCFVSVNDYILVFVIVFVSRFGR